MKQIKKPENIEITQGEGCGQVNTRVLFDGVDITDHLVANAAVVRFEMHGTFLDITRVGDRGQPVMMRCKLDRGTLSFHVQDVKFPECFLPNDAPYPRCRGNGFVDCRECIYMKGYDYIEPGSRRIIWISIRNSMGLRG